jgi:hypothetical protein
MVGARWAELLEVGFGERVELLLGLRDERDPHDAPAGGVRVAPDRAVCLGAMDQPDGAVVAQHQVVGDLADRRPGRIAVVADRQQQLVLGGDQPPRRGPAALTSTKAA